MKSHINRITSTCFYHLWRLCAVRRQFGQQVTRRLVSSFILSRLDYCNAILAGLLSSTLYTAAAGDARRCQGYYLRPQAERSRHLSTSNPPLASSETHDQFKLCPLLHLAINKRAPTYLQDLLTTTASMPGRASNRSSINDLIEQSTRLKLGESAFSVAAPCICNRLPTQLKTTTNTAYFSLHTASPNTY